MARESCDNIYKYIQSFPLNVQKGKIKLGDLLKVLLA